MLNKLFSSWRKPPVTPTLPPGVPNPGVRIVDGKIVPQYACQADVVDHCNLACRDCDHLAPVARKRHADPDAIYRDFSRLAKVYRPRLVQLLGGEPLLHPHLPAVIDAVRASGISARIMVVTNGLLLPRMPERFWETVSDIEISSYPGSGLTREAIHQACAKARGFGVGLEVYHFDGFRRVFSRDGGPDPALTQRIYRACKKVWVWGCHTVYDGHIYRCPQSIFLTRVLGLPPAQITRDGLALSDGPGFREELLAFLTSPQPLQACRHCLATAGVLRPNIQVKRGDWLAEQDGAIAELVDYAELARIEADLHINRPDHIKTLIAKHAP